MRIKNHYYLSIALHLASLWNRGLSQLGNSPHWRGLICLLHCSAHSNLQLALCFLLIGIQIKRLTKIIFDSKQSRVFKNWSIWAAIGNKTFETVYSNRVTSGNKTIQNPTVNPVDSKTQGKCQKLVKFSAICQLSVKILAICQLSLTPSRSSIESSGSLKDWIDWIGCFISLS